MPRSEAAPAQEIRFCRGTGRRAPRVREARLGSAARRRLVLAGPPPVRLAEPGLAPLPRGPRGYRDDLPLRRARLRPVGLGRRGLLPRGPGRRPRGGHRGRGARALCAPRHVGRRPGRHHVRGTASGAGDATDPVRRRDRRKPAAERPNRRPSRTAYEALIRVGWAREDSQVPPGVHLDVHPGCDRRADALAGRPAAHGDLDRERDREPAGPDARRRPPPAAERQGADVEPAGSKRSDGAVRSGAGGLRVDPGSPTRPARVQQPHPARRRAGLAGLPARGRGVHGAGRGTACARARRRRPERRT